MFIYSVLYTFIFISFYILLWDIYTRYKYMITLCMLNSPLTAICAEITVSLIYSNFTFYKCLVCREGGGVEL